MADSTTYRYILYPHLILRVLDLTEVCVFVVQQTQVPGATNDKVHGGRVGIVKLEDGRPANLNTSDLDSAWNNTYYRSVRQMMLAGEKPKLSKVL